MKPAIRLEYVVAEILRDRFSYNTEIIVQLGAHDGNSVRAMNIETDWKYYLRKVPGRPALGLKIDWSTGDRKQGDGVIQTFNPLFCQPGDLQPCWSKYTG